MFNPGYYITAELKVKVPENIDKARQHLKELCEETLKEPSCSIFTLHQCVDDKSRFLLWERFNSEDDFKYHFEQAHTQEYLKHDLTEVVQYFVTDVL
ncbi:putative quinol monooxygenase [Aeromonas veronii]|uniref:putative quinol monooxygenase n=1 Tax=Aeromonas veronii TaxID=654 RepID=UPI00191F86DD|nr:antibiotic biosynthesis monooxygenase [Aeromonas veronii]MBL0615470.1 antibiotic biosynthesis monooxygenase [Aeromonas veronii]